MTDEPISDEELEAMWRRNPEGRTWDDIFGEIRIGLRNSVEYTDVDAVSEAIGLHWTEETDGVWAARVTDGTILGVIRHRRVGTRDRYELHSPLLKKPAAWATLKVAKSKLAGDICRRLEHPDSPYT